MKINIFFTKTTYEYSLQKCSWAQSEDWKWISKQILISLQHDFHAERIFNTHLRQHINITNLTTIMNRLNKTMKEAISISHYHVTFDMVTSTIPWHTVDTLPFNWLIPIESHVPRPNLELGGNIPVTCNYFIIFQGPITSL